MMQAQQDIENVITSLKRRVKELEVENGELTAQVMQLSAVGAPLADEMVEWLPPGMWKFLTRNEMTVVNFLARHRGKIVSRARMMSVLYPDPDKQPEAKIIDVLVCKIRKKLLARHVSFVVTTAWGRGYMLEELNH